MLREAIKPTERPSRGVGIEKERHLAIGSRQQNVERAGETEVFGLKKNFESLLIRFKIGKKVFQKRLRAVGRSIIGDENLQRKRTCLQKRFEAFFDFCGTLVRHQNNGYF